MILTLKNMADIRKIIDAEMLDVLPEVRHEIFENTLAQSRTTIIPHDQPYVFFAVLQPLVATLFTPDQATTIISNLVIQFYKRRFYDPIRDDFYTIWEISKL